MAECPAVPVIGLIGGIGSGKSSVAREFARTGSAVVLDADHAGHLALEQADIKSRIRSRFGAEVFDSEGKVLRKQLAQLVFGSSSRHRQALHDLEQILHPAIREVFDRAIEQARAEGTAEVILLDAAVLLEAGWQDRCDAVVFVNTPPAIRRERILIKRGWSEEELQRREASQLSLEEKQRRSDYHLDNSGSLADASRQLGQFISQTVARCREQSGSS
ncbi:MAG: dephospho-CoA kinase [Planctomycetaceae bacterium]|nr:dephospho-CoA kinase [Planctomycetaceae bacterium]